MIPDPDLRSSLYSALILEAARRSSGSTSHSRRADSRTSSRHRIFVASSANPVAEPVKRQA